MTIIEAVKSGRPFRRKSDVKKYGDEWYCYPRSRAEKFKVFFLDLSMSENEALMRDVLATDWEVRK